MTDMAKHERPITIAEVPVRLFPLPAGQTLSPEGERVAPSGWKAWVVGGFTLLIALGLAAYAIAASYESVTALAAAHHVPLPRLVPAGLEGGLFGVITVNVALTWTGRPVGWLRQAARLFAAGIVAANVAAGWPDPVGVGLRIAPPVLFVMLTEVAVTVILRGQAEATGTEGVPFTRWLLSPWSTFRLWRRMKLWRIRSYPAAVDMELARLRAVEQMKERFGSAWQKTAPGDLTWMLRRGVHMEDALARVAELTAEPEVVPEPRKPAGNGSRNRKPARRGGGTRNRKPARTPAPRPAPGPADEVGVDTEAMILDLAERGKSPAEIIVDLVNQRGMSPSAAGVAAGKSDRYGREVYGKYQALSKGGRKEPAGRDLR